MIAAMYAAMLDDVYWPLYRMFGGHGGPATRANPMEFNPSNSRQFISALRSKDGGWLATGQIGPLTRRQFAFPTMRELGYGSFYNMETGARNFGATAAEQELLTKGVGTGGILFGRPMKGLSQLKEHGAANFGKIGLGLGVSAAVLQTAFAPRGHKLSGMVGGISAMAGFGIADMLGTLVGGPVLGFVAGYAGGELGNKMGEAFQSFTEINRRVRHIDMGGNYQDTELAYTMRQRAAQELGSSILNARQYLGKEALLMHQ